MQSSRMKWIKRPEPEINYKIYMYMRSNGIASQRRRRRRCNNFDRNKNKIRHRNAYTWHTYIVSYSLSLTRTHTHINLSPHNLHRQVRRKAERISFSFCTIFILFIVFHDKLFATKTEKRRSKFWIPFCSAETHPHSFLFPISFWMHFPMDECRRCSTGPKAQQTQTDWVSTDTTY